MPIRNLLFPLSLFASSFVLASCGGDGGSGPFAAIDQAQEEQQEEQVVVSSFPEASESNVARVVDDKDETEQVSSPSESGNTGTDVITSPTDEETEVVTIPPTDEETEVAVTLPPAPPVLGLLKNLKKGAAVTRVSFTDKARLWNRGYLGVGTYFDGQPYRIGQPLPDSPPSYYRVRGPGLYGYRFHTGADIDGDGQILSYRGTGGETMLVKAPIAEQTLGALTPFFIGINVAGTYEERKDLEYPGRTASLFLGYKYENADAFLNSIHKPTSAVVYDGKYAIVHSHSVTDIRSGDLEMTIDFSRPNGTDAISGTAWTGDDNRSDDNRLGTFSQGDLLSPRAPLVAGYGRAYSGLIFTGVDADGSPTDLTATLSGELLGSQAEEFVGGGRGDGLEGVSAPFFSMGIIGARRFPAPPPPPLPSLEEIGLLANIVTEGGTGYFENNYALYVTNNGYVYEGIIREKENFYLQRHDNGITQGHYVISTGKTEYHFHSGADTGTGQVASNDDGLLIKSPIFEQTFTSVASAFIGTNVTDESTRSFVAVGLFEIGSESDYTPVDSVPTSTVMYDGHYVIGALPTGTDAGDSNFRQGTLEMEFDFSVPLRFYGLSQNSITGTAWDKNGDYSGSFVGRRIADPTRNFFAKFTGEGTLLKYKATVRGNLFGTNAEEFLATGRGKQTTIEDGENFDSVKSLLDYDSVMSIIGERRDRDSLPTN